MKLPVIDISKQSWKYEIINCLWIHLENQYSTAACLFFFSLSFKDLWAVLCTKMEPKFERADVGKRWSLALLWKSDYFNILTVFFILKNDLNGIQITGEK